MTASDRRMRVCIRRVYGWVIAGVSLIPISAREGHAHDPLRAFGVQTASSDASHGIIQTNRGLLLYEAQQGRFLCSAGIGAHGSETLPLVRMDDGGWMVATSGGLHRLDAQGCPARVPGVLESANVTDIAEAPGRPGVFIAVTSEAERGSAIYRSDDGGHVWQALTEADTGRFYNALHVASAPSPWMFVSGLRVDREASTYDAFVARYGDQEESFVTVELSPTETQVRVEAIDPRDPRVLYARTMSRREVDPEERILRSEDGGLSFEPYWSADAIEQVSVSEAGDVWVLDVDGLRGFGADGEALVDVAREWPLRSVDASDVLVVTDALGVMVSSDRARSFTPVFDYAQVLEPVVCSADALVEEACAGAWAHFDEERTMPRPVGAGAWEDPEVDVPVEEPRDGLEDGDPPSEGCRVAGSTRNPAYVLFLALLAGRLLRPRHRR